MSLGTQELHEFNFEIEDRDIENELEKLKNNLDNDNRP